MFIIELAQLKIKIDNQYPFIQNQCKDYIIDSDNFDFLVSVSNEEIELEKRQSISNFPNGYLESICLYRKIALTLPKYDCILLHAAVVKVDNFAYAFCAKSGTGKTTHTKLWKQLLQDKMTYINGDKPLIRIIDNIPYAFGTPWNGKEGFGTKDCAILKAIAFIERDSNNSIVDLQTQNILNRIIHQILLPKDLDTVNQTFDTLNNILNYTKTYLLKCNMDIEAAIIAYNKMKE